MLTNLFKNDKAMAWVLVILAVISLFVPLCNLIFAPDSPLYFSAYTVSILGKYMTFALLGMSLDLVWGYCGILALGHGAFFALGGYVMGMYLMRQIGARGVYANPILPDFMVFLNWKELPAAWWGFHSFAYASVMVMLVPGVLAFAFGW